jgi:hypothetical protein
MPSKKISAKAFNALFDANFYKKKETIPLLGSIERIYSKFDGSIFHETMSRLKQLFEWGFTKKFQCIDDLHYNTACQLAFNPIKKTWVGFSFRAYHIFHIGYKIPENADYIGGGFTPGTRQYNAFLKKFPKYKPGFTCRTQKDCKTLAKLFAISAS